jgi:hypothetical protein
MSNIKKVSPQSQVQQIRPRAEPSMAASPAAMAIHNNFRNAMAGLQREMVRSIYYLRLIFDRNIYRALGYSNIRHYAAHHGGLNEDQCKAFLRIGAKLERLPAMKKALEEGSLSWRKANIIVGEADSQNEEKLVELAKQLTEVALKDARAKPGQKIDPNPCPPPRKRPDSLPLPKVNSASTPVGSGDELCYVAFKFTPEQYSYWAAFNAQKGAMNKEEAIIEAIRGGGSARKGPGSDYLLIIQECPTCGQATFSNNRGTFKAPQALLETVRCDATVQDQEARRRKVIPPRLKRQVLQRDGHRCQAEGCSNTGNLQLHHRIPVAQGGPTSLDNLVTLCARCHRTLHEQESELRILGKDPTD